jgi:hypothetical protein
MSTITSKDNAAKFLIEYKQNAGNVQIKNCEEPYTKFSDIAENQIRAIKLDGKTVYILILLIAENENTLFVPFSGYAFPATNEELLLSEQYPIGMRVLQLWNERTWHSSFLKDSYECIPVTPIPPDIFDISRRILYDSIPEEVQVGIELSEYSLEDLKLVLQYKKEELSKFAFLDEADIEYWETH